MTFEDLKSLVDKAKYKRELLSDELKETQKNVASLKNDINASHKVLAIIQTVAKETQSQIEYQISNLVTLALKSVFPDPYRFRVKFVERRGKTECDLIFEKNSVEFGFDEIGGGVLDVAAFALRISLWAIQNPRSRNVFIFDEPFKNINDPKRILHQKVAEMVRMVSQMMKVQVIVISSIPEMEGIADKIFVVKQNDSISFIS